MIIERKIIQLDDLVENTWNPNQMSPSQWDALGESFQEFSAIDPLTVRKHPDKDGYQIIDGAHRYRKAKEMGLLDLPCDVIEVSDTQAKRLTQILNRTRGQDDPVKLKELLDSLVSEVGVEQTISGMAIADEEALNTVLSELKGKIESVESEDNAYSDDDTLGWDDAFDKVQEGDKEPFQQMTITLHDEQKDIVDDAFRRAKQDDLYDDTVNSNSNGNALFVVCQKYLNGIS